jgi:hypothetical protein
MQLLLPCDDMYLRSAATQRVNYPVGRYDRLSHTVEKELACLLEKEINYHVRVESAKAELTRRHDWSNRAAFESVDTSREYALNHRNVQSFLRINGYYATESEVVAIIRRLDVDADQKVSYDEFAEGFRLSSSYVSDSHSSSYAASKYEETKRSSSPLREHSPSRSYAGASQSIMQASVMSRSELEPRVSHSSPIRPRTEVTRDLMQKSETRNSPLKYESPSRGGSYYQGSTYGAK